MNGIPGKDIPRAMTPRIVFGAQGLPPGLYAAKVGKAENSHVWGFHVPVYVLPGQDPNTADHTVWVGQDPDGC